MSTKKNGLTAEEKLIKKALIGARDVQNYLLRDHSLRNQTEFYLTACIKLFQKRIDCLQKVDLTLPSAKIEIRKRILQQASLSIMALLILDRDETN